MATMRPSAVSFLTIAILVLRQDIGFDFLDTELAGDSLGRRFVVAVSITIRMPVAPNAVEGRLRRCLDRVGNGDDATRLAVDR